jgi:sulfur-carrier protein adenylyltransferase/sulfurtransferase
VPGVLPGIVGSIQAVEVIKLIWAGVGDDLSGRLLAYDSLEPSFRTHRMVRPQCPTCSIDPERIVIAEYDELCMPHPIAPPPAG